MSHIAGSGKESARLIQRQQVYYALQAPEDARVFVPQHHGVQSTSRTMEHTDPESKSCQVSSQEFEV